MRRWLCLVISLMALGSMGSWAFGEARSMRDTSEAAQMTKKMKAACVGRYLIDVPDRSEISLSHERIHGFAIDTNKNEQVAMHLSMPDHPDLVYTLLSVAGGRPGPGLLARSALVDANASAEEMLRVTTLRSEQRNINSMDGEEVVERIREFNFTTSYTLSWETRGAEGDLLHPYLSLELQAGKSDTPGGKPVDTSLHEDALLALWDRIASSIRPRSPDPISPRPNPGRADPRPPVAP